MSSIDEDSSTRPTRPAKVALTSTLDNIASVLMKKNRHLHTHVSRECLRVLGRREHAVTALERALRIRQATRVPGTELAQTQFELARALWANPSSRSRARGRGTVQLRQGWQNRPKKAVQGRALADTALTRGRWLIRKAL